MATSSSRTPARKRQFLSSLAEGHTVKRACQLSRVPLNTYKKWRRVDDVFSQQIDRLLDDDETKAKADYQLACGKRAPEKGWEERFYLAYASTKSRAQACLQAGLSATDVQRMLDPEHDDHNVEFAAMVKEVELRILWEIEDTELTKGLVDSRSAQFVLSSRMKQKYGKSPFADSAHQVNNFWFTDGGEREAMKAINAAIGVEEPESGSPGNQAANGPARLLESGSAD